MGDENGQPPGGGGYQDRGGGGGGVNGNMSLGVARSETQKKNVLYSDRLKTHVRYDQRLKRNVLEITLEKTNNDAVFDDVNEEAVGRVFKTLGINIETQVQGSQIHYRGKTSVISVWMVAGVSLDRFCKDINIKVTPGVMTGMIRPAGKTDVTVSVEGLDFNTPDNFVVDYMNKFGNVLSTASIYSKYESGPLKGKYNGQRKYQVDFSKGSRQMGTYHLIDGCKVRVFYRGNKKTCGRCHKQANECPGNAIARNCSIGGGSHVFLSDHMKKLWGEIGFTPVSFELDETDKTEDDIQQAIKDAPIDTVKFPTPVFSQKPNERDVEHFDGITVKNFPSTLDDKDILTFLMNHGLPFDHGIENIHINKAPKNTWVVIDGLQSSDVQTMFRTIHFPESKARFFDVPLYCKALRNTTPVKKPENAEEASEDVPNVAMPGHGNAGESSSTTKHSDPKENETTKPTIPGLPEEERLKKKKRKKKVKQKKPIETEAKNLSMKDFLVSPQTGIMKESMSFEFSDYSDPSSNDSDDDVEFEDSRETFSDGEKTEVAGDVFTPVSLKSTFARSLALSSAKTSSSIKITPIVASRRSKSSSQTSAVKRLANSPPAEKDLKKSRSQSRSRSRSLIPKKK